MLSPQYLGGGNLDAREEALRKRHIKQGEGYENTPKDYLHSQSAIVWQHQKTTSTGNRQLCAYTELEYYQLKWDKTGIIIKIGHFN